MKSGSKSGNVDLVGEAGVRGVGDVAACGLPQARNPSQDE